MKFAHLADCHIGGWREPELKELSIKSFEKAINICIKEHVGFVLISGDLFDTSLPSIDIIKETAAILNKLREYDISCYIIPGSHDFSPSGKTMLDVLEHSGLVENVMKFKDNKLIFTEDKTGVKITGIYGKKGALEVETYKTLEKEHLENEEGFKIFMFHSLLEELKPKDFPIEGHTLNLLPKNFNYYAGGHPHFITSKEYPNYGIISYPGPIFPNNFKELEELKWGSFFIVEFNDKIEIKNMPLEIKKVHPYNINADNKTPLEIQKEIDNIEETDGIILLRIEGILKDGKPTDIKFKEIPSYTFLKNTSKLLSREAEEIKISETANIEEDFVKEFNRKKIFDDKVILDLMSLLDKEKEEGERIIDFEERVIKDIKKLLEIEI